MTRYYVSVIKGVKGKVIVDGPGSDAWSSATMTSSLWRPATRLESIWIWLTQPRFSWIGLLIIAAIASIVNQIIHWVTGS